MPESYLNHEPRKLDKSFIKYEFDSDRDKKSALNEYLEIIRQYLKSLIDSLKDSGEWKSQSSKHIDRNPNKYFKGIIICKEIDEIINETFKSLLISFCNER